MRPDLESFFLVLTGHRPRGQSGPINGPVSAADTRPDQPESATAAPSDSTPETPA